MKEIINFHAHIYPDKIADKAAQSIGDFYDIHMGNNGKVDTLLHDAARAGVNRIVVQSVATSPQQVRSINAFIAEECAKHPQLIGLGALHPQAEDIETEIRNIEELGLRGVKLHPDFQQFHIDDRSVYPLYEILEGRLPLLLHTGDHRYEYSRPGRLAAVLRDFPNLCVVAAHFGGWQRWEESIDVLLQTNCYIDTSSSIAFLGVRRAKEMMDAFGAERVLFGTDFPMWRADEELAYFDEMGLSEKEQSLIFAENAKRVLRI